MIFATPIFEKSFEVTENEIPVLVIENKAYFRDLINSLILEQDGISGDFSFFFKDKEVNQKKDLELILNFFDLDINKTKNLTKLYSFIKTEFVKEEKYLETVNLTTSILSYMSEITAQSDFSLVYEEDIDITTIFKSLNLRFYYEETTMLEKLVDYIKIMSKFFQKKVFVLVGLKSMFTQEEQEEFYKFLFYEKISVLVIENCEQQNRLFSEKYRIIDEDLCVIY